MPDIINDESLLQYVNTDHILHFVKAVYQNAIDIDSAYMVEVRKLGTYAAVDGTTHPADQSTAAQILQFDQENWQSGLAQWVARSCMAAAPVGIGCFLAPALLDDKRATDKSVKMLTTICADFDVGNPGENLNQLSQRMGMRPTIVSHSGGITDEGHQKLHAHWRLTEPSDDPWKIAYIREQIAKNFGADQSFKRIPQVIRIPGALYDKNRQFKTTEIIEYNDHDIELMDVEDTMQIDWEALEEDSIYNQKTRTKEEKQERVHKIQTEKIEAGAVGEDNRFTRFSEYAGHQIRQARFEHQSVEEALSSTHIWCQDNMVPPWEVDRIESEFNALLHKDKASHADRWAEQGRPPIMFGNTPVQPAVQPIEGSDHGTLIPQEAPPAQTAADWKLKTFAVPRLYSGPAPEERHLIENFMVHNSTLALVADGGVGKTYVSIELGMRAAAGPCVIDGQKNEFMGFPVLEKMNVLIFTVEDGQHDLHRRVRAIDPSGSLEEAAGDNCCIIPVQEQILDGLTLVERDDKGNWKPSVAWKAMQNYIDDFMQDEDTKDYPLFVIIDTYSATHHGDENSATGTNEWFRSAGLLRRYDTTLLVTHHVRKADQKMEIKTVEDMKANVRGSSAFMNACRTVYGIWKMPNGDSVLEETPVEKGAQLFNMGMLKNNTGLSWAERSSERFADPLITLRRLATGRLTFDAMIHAKRLELSDNRTKKIENNLAQAKAAIKAAVRWYGHNGWALSKRSIIKDKERFLPENVAELSEKKLASVLNELLVAEEIKEIELQKPKCVVFDVPDGDFYSGKNGARKKDTPAIHWNEFEYDAENEEYSEIENVQTRMNV